MKMNPSAQEILDEIKSGKQIQRIIMTPELQNKLIKGTEQAIDMFEKLDLSPLESLALLEILRNSIQETMGIEDVNAFGFTEDVAKA